MRLYLTGPIASGKSTHLAHLLDALPPGTHLFGYATRWQSPQARGRGHLLIRDFARPEAPPLPLDPHRPDAPAALLAALLPLLQPPVSLSPAAGVRRASEPSAPTRPASPVLAIDELGLLEHRAPAPLFDRFLAALRTALAAAPAATLILQQRALAQWLPLLPPPTRLLVSPFPPPPP